MAKADPAQPDPLARDLERAASLYAQLAARIAPSQQTGVGRRTPAASRPPINVDMASAMAELRTYLDRWTHYAAYLLNPVTRVEVTDRTGACCPYCGAKLVAWLRPEHPERAEIVCCNLTPHYDPPGRWLTDEWPRLGVLAGVHVDARFGPRLQVVPDA
jgi:hypothetical protein